MTGPRLLPPDGEPDAADMAPERELQAAYERGEAKLLPSSHEAEHALLSALFFSEEKLAMVAEMLHPDDFHDKRHREVFAAVLDCFGRSLPVDLMSVAEFLRNRDKYQAIGGADFLLGLARAESNPALAFHFASVVREKARLRRFIAEANELVAEAFKTTGNPDDVQALIDRATGSMLALATGRGRSTDAVSWDQAARAKVQSLREARQQGRRAANSTGFVSLDAKLNGGFRPGQLIVIGARPGMGKSALALDFIERMATEDYQPVALLLSLEMLAEEIAGRSFARQLSEQWGRISLEGAGEEDAAVLDQIVADRGRLMRKVFILDSPQVSLNALEMKARALRKEHGRLDLVLVDYLQLMKAEGRAENRVQEISGITGALKRMAQSLRVPVVALSQLNRSVEARPDKKPGLADLRESGSIEQDADIVMLIYRPSYYGLGTDPEEATIIIPKSRGGSTGEVALRWLGPSVCFDEPAWKTEDINAAMLRNER